MNAGHITVRDRRGREKPQARKSDRRVRQTGRVAVQSRKSCASCQLNAAREVKNGGVPHTSVNQGSIEDEIEGSESNVCRRGH